MKNKAEVLSVALFLSAFIMLALFGGQEAEWKGKIEIENGIKVIKNPGEPLYGEIKLELEEDLSIGREGDDNYMFYRLRDIEVDSQGNIYVVDMSNYRIQKFDKNGKYLQTVGRQGQGPGEFEQPTRIRINDLTGKIYVRDRAVGIDIFNKRGEYIKGIHLKNVIYDIRPLGDENILVIISKASDSELTYTHSLSKINSEGKIMKVYAEYPYTRYARKMEGGAILSRRTGYELSIHLSKPDVRTFVYGYSKEYELNVVSSEGQLLYKIKKDEPSPKFTSEEKRRFKKIPLPEFKPYFFVILNDSKGRIYVQRNKAEEVIRGIGPYDTSQKEVDVFSKDGFFLFKTTLPANTRIIKNGFLYTYVMDEEEGTEYVKRFRIKNWEQIKEGI